MDVRKINTETFWHIFVSEHEALYEWRSKVDSFKNFICEAVSPYLQRVHSGEQLVTQEDWHLISNTIENIKEETTGVVELTKRINMFVYLHDLDPLFPELPEYFTAIDVMSELGETEIVSAFENNIIENLEKLMTA